jgi:hypothetical protein
MVPLILQFVIQSNQYGIHLPFLANYALKTFQYGIQLLSNAKVVPRSTLSLTTLKINVLKRYVQEEAFGVKLNFDVSLPQSLVLIIKCIISKLETVLMFANPMRYIMKIQRPVHFLPQKIKPKLIKQQLIKQQLQIRRK